MCILIKFDINMIGLNKNLINSGGNTPEVTTKTIGSKTFICVPFIVTEDTKNGHYEWVDIDLRPHEYNYDGLVNAIVGLKYNFSKELAVMNNYMASPKDVDAKLEFDELQDWRKLAKTYAKKILNIE